MPEYQFAEKDGSIVTLEYDKSSNFSSEQVLVSIKNSFDIFPIDVNVEQVEEMDDVFHVTFPNGNSDMGEIYICAKGTTPGGRSGLKDEQRIQPKAKFLNYVYDQEENGKKAVFLGVYSRDDQTILCTWKVSPSAASSPDTPISKQIKITSIAKAMKEGFVQQDKGKGEYACAFKPEFLYFYLRNSDWLHTGHVSELAEHTHPQSNGDDSEGFLEEKESANVKYSTGLESEFERNRIVFGAPGTGKSFRLKSDCRKLLEGSIGDYERVTFHPDYTYSQFVGTYKPVTDSSEEGKIKYEFVPGPFMRVLVQALKNSRSNIPQPYLLIIEEINRAKVASVFGDIFQLLDRDDYGVSEYEIQTSEDIRRFLAKELGGEPSDYQKLKLPDNMFIWATMNSADQGVFPMDTAFKRRWNFEYIGINDNEDKIKGIGKVKIAGFDRPVEWNEIRKAINLKMSSNDFKINEDKLMGPFFLSNKLLDSDISGIVKDNDKFIEAFKNKVIMYLYEDAVKQSKHRFFDGCDSSKYSSVCDAFDDIGLGIFGADFIETYYEK